ncbi:FAD:protein FMN transferase [hydrothermal vent metagenome]|uniref:FAD:protein FMN transferase n=1 Tax=hydrothermal vent metagenome TaxID=652676 RepID=A0A3B1BCQ9_9ZZZZ
MSLSHRFLSFLILIFILSSSACQQASREYKQTQLVFGTLVNITLRDIDPALAQKSFAQIRLDLDFMHEVWHPWKPGPLGRTNALLATGGWFSANPSVIPVFEKGRELAALTDNLFNPAIGKLIALWGYHQDDPPNGPPPSKAAIDQLLAHHPRMADIEFDGLRMRSLNPAVQLDFGAMGKGLAIDRIIDYLRSQGINNAVINAGGDLKVIGSHGDRPWRIGIRHPRPKGDNTVLAALEVNDGESVFTSGDYERFYIYEGRRYHHIIDPRTGYPADQTTSVTVIHNDAASADAAATALFIAGPDGWQAIARKMQLRYVMLVDKNGQIIMTPAMAERINLIDTQNTPLIIQP